MQGRNQRWYYHIQFRCNPSLNTARRRLGLRRPQSIARAENSGKRPERNAGKIHWIQCSERRVGQIHIHPGLREQEGRIGSSERPGDKLSIAEFRLSIFQSQIENRKSEIGVNRSYKRRKIPFKAFLWTILRRHTLLAAGFEFPCELHCQGLLCKNMSPQLTNMVSMKYTALQALRVMVICNPKWDEEKTKY